MKVYIGLALFAFFIYCEGADKNIYEVCTKDDKCLGDTSCVIPKGCSSGRCSCGSGKERDGSTNNCKDEVDDKDVGESCTATSDCGGAFVSCTDKKCTCNTGYSANENNYGCNKHVGDSCSVDTDCGGGTYMKCTSLKCACQDAFKEEDGSCRSYYVEESCTTGKSSCSGSACTDGTCKCTVTDYVPYLWQCVHKDAKKNIGKGDECNQAFTASGKLCGKGLSCGLCPEGGGKYVCMSGAVTIKHSVVMALISVALLLLNF